MVLGKGLVFCASCHCPKSDMRLFGNVDIRLVFCFVTVNCHMYGGLLIHLQNSA